MELEELKKWAGEGLSVREISAHSGKSYTTVRYWLKKFGLKTRGVSFKDQPPPYEDEVFRQLVAEELSVAGVLRRMKKPNASFNYRMVRRGIKKLGLSTDHWRPNQPPQPGTTIPWEEVLIEGSPYTMNGSRKRRLIRQGLLENRCAVCGRLPEWEGNPLSLILDHINGIRNDHRLGNLRLVCPNCDSQLATFCGRNKRRKSPGS
jgi:transposase